MSRRRSTRCCCGHAKRKHDPYSLVCTVTACRGCSYFGCPKPTPATDAEVRQFLEEQKEARRNALDAEREEETARRRGQRP